MRDLVKERYWRRLLRRWQRSGLTTRAFCAKQGVSEANFHWWRRELARRDGQDLSAGKQTLGRATVRPIVTRQASRTSAPAFLKLALDPGASTPPAIEVVLSERRSLRVRPGFDADLLRQLVRLLEEPSC
jgi:transposase